MLSTSKDRVGPLRSIFVWDMLILSASNLRCIDHLNLNIAWRPWLGLITRYMLIYVESFRLISISDNCRWNLRVSDLEINCIAWWRHQMETFSVLLAFLWGEYTSHQRITLTKACGAEFWCCLWSIFEQTVKQTIEMPMILEPIALIMTSVQ